MLKTSILTLSLAIAGTAAFAQTATPDPDAAAAAAKNQLGILEYCVAEGHIDGAAVETQTKMMEMLPAVQNQEVVDAAYAKGKEGTVSAMGVEQTLADAATAQKSDVKSLCGQLSAMVEQAASQMPK